MALECLAAAIGKCVGNLVAACTSPYLRYFFRFGKIVEDFKNRRNELKSKRDEVKDAVDEALRQTEVIKKGVEEWLTKAEKELGEAQSLEEEIERNKCFDWCPSWGWRYCLSIKVAKKTLYISQLLAEACNFQRVGQRPPLQGIEFLLPKDFMASESSISAFNGIMKALNSNGVNMIGLYGMPGVGKTTLAEVVGKQAKEQKLFDKVVSVSVSQTPNFNEIRERIAELLGLKFEASTEKGKVEELWRRLKGEKKILIILDDVWKKLELQTIRIPFGGEHDGCKILLTTRLQQVCTQMDCHKEFELNILSEDEAWALFKDKAGLKDDSPALNVAEEVARECGCLPLAIVTVAQALKGQSRDEWIAANKRLKSSRHLDNLHVCGHIYRCLKFSYDFLDQENIQQCFLLCSLFPEDYEISIELLTICGIGQGLFNNNYLMEDLRREIQLALSKLQKSGLLLEVHEKEHVKMHDVVRDFAHWITSRGEKIFMVKDGLTEWPMSESFECYMAISLWNSQVNNFSDKLGFSTLKILVLTVEDSLRVQNTFFGGMKTLQVLLLKGVVFSLEALQFLTNLRTLCFIYCELENISSLRNVENLEVLALLKTNIQELPEELVELHRLKSLYFSYSGKQDSNFPPNLLSRLAPLQELHVTTENNVNLSELNALSGLTALTLRVSTDQCSQENFVFPKLPCYNIAVNEYLQDLKGLSLRTLKISVFSSSLNAFKELFCNVEDLTLLHVTMEHKNIVPNVDQWGLKELTSLNLDSCDNLECLIDTTREQRPTIAFSKLVNLVIDEMTSLKELCHGQSPISFLKKLEKLSIFHCEQLHSVFPMNWLLGKEESQTQTISNLRSLKLRSLPTLESIWKEPTHHVSLQSLKEVIILRCHKLKSIFSPCLAQSLLHLEKLEISKCKKLEQVFAFDKEMAELEENQVQPLSNLTCLELMSLPELNWIWKGSTHFVSLQSLKFVEISYCNRLNYLFSTSLAQSLVLLEELKIDHCDGLQHIITEPNAHLHSPFLPKLENLEITDCPGLEYVFQIPFAQVLPRLKSLRITDSPQLQQVFPVAKETIGVDRAIALPCLQDLRLGNLINLGRFCSENCLISSPSLEELEVYNCPKLINFTIQKEVKEQVQLKHVQLHALKELLYNAKSLTLDSVTYQKNLIPNVDPKWLNELTFLALKRGKELECLIDTTEGHASTNCLFNLVELVIREMTGFKMLCKGQFPKGFLQNLEKLEARNCTEMVSLSPALQNLKEVTVIDCAQLQEVFQIDELLCDTEENEGPLLSNLKLMKLHSLPELNWIWKGSTRFVSLQSLKFVEISYCNRLNYLFSTSLAQSLVLLEELKIDHCDGLQHIITEPNAHLHSPFLPKLETLEITDCPRLEYVFQIPFTQLQQVFHVAKEMIGVDRAIALPCLQDLRLVNLINLGCFCSENFLISSPSLKELEVYNCPKLINFTIQKEVKERVQLKDVQLHALKELLYNAKSLTLDSVTYQKNLIPNVDSKWLNELTFLALKRGKELECLIDTTEGHASTNCLFNLVELVIREMTGFKMLCKGQFPKGFLQNLEKLRARNCTEMVSLSPALQNLKEVTVIDCAQLQEVFQIDELLCDTEENEGPLLSNLKLMKLHSLPELNWIWKGSTRFVSLQSLKFVEISYCNRLNYLFSPSLAQSLVLLEQLKIDHCDGLQHIITEPNAHLHSPFLPKLETLKITDCPRLEYVFQIPMAQVLPRLKSFRITDSPQLQQVFHVAKETIGVDRAVALPCLQDLRLVNLINLACFCSENFLISSPSLEELEVYNCPKLINFTIQKEVKEQVQLKELSLSKLGNSFQLHISTNCNQEYIAVGSHEEAFQIHGRIKELHLEDLSEVQIIWKDVAQVATLKNLTRLEVIDCKRLRCLFPLGFACCLPKLQKLLVKGNSKLEQVFEVEDEAKAMAEKEIKFDQLQELSLVELPSLVDFCPMGYHFVLPALSFLIVRECPKMTTGFFIDSKEYVHAKTETPQLVEQDAISWGRDCGTLPPWKEEL